MDGQNKVIQRVPTVISQSTKANKNYLFLDVFERIRRIDSEADQDDMRIRVRKGTQTIVVFLASGIPKSKLNFLSVQLELSNVILKDCGDIDLFDSDLSEYARVFESSRAPGRGKSQAEGMARRIMSVYSKV